MDFIVYRNPKHSKHSYSTGKKSHSDGSRAAYIHEEQPNTAKPREPELLESL